MIGEVVLDWFATTISITSVHVYNGLAQLLHAEDLDEWIPKLAFWNSSALALGFSMFGETVEDLAKHLLTSPDAEAVTIRNTGANMLEAFTEVMRLLFNAIIVSRNLADLLQNVPGHELLKLSDFFLASGMGLYVGQLLWTGVTNVLGLLDNIRNLGWLDWCHRKGKVFIPAMTCFSLLTLPLEQNLKSGTHD